ncbi:hypothetical protein MKX01_037044 [Papaver californicum]|nr:hypothetical protein MKX01_037044 [Papaver californicum]
MELCCRGATSAATATSLVSISWSNSISSNSVHPTSVRICQPKRAIKVLCLTTNTTNNGNGSTNQPQKGNQMTVSITGATGFIGERLVQRLHQENHRVRVLTRSKSKAQLVFPGKKLGSFLEL